MPDSIPATPADLAKAAACFCFDEPAQRAVMIYLLATIAGGSMDPATLIQQAKCFCFNQQQADKVITFLLCQVAAQSET